MTTITTTAATSATTPSASTTAPTAEPRPELFPGLAGVYLATTRTSRVDGENGSLWIGGFAVEELAPRASFEETALLLWTGDLPDADTVKRFRRDLATRRRLPTAASEMLARAAERGLSPMDALRVAAGTFDWAEDPEPASGFEPATLALLARMPVAVAAYDRLRRGLEPVVEDPAFEDPAFEGLGYAEAFLYHLDGRAPSRARARALDTYLNTVVDHGLNASTFTARVILSTGADWVSAVVGALGALSGPLHGGAPGPALGLVREIGRPERAEEVLRAKLEAGERLMGFGHRVYKVRDPRAVVLRAAAEELFREDAGERAEGRRLFELAREVESVAVRLLDEHKPGRRLRTNVEFYTALLLHGLGLDADTFTPVFAVARTAGWIAHGREQRRDGRLIRPRLLYEGPLDRKYPA